MLPFTIRKIHNPSMSDSDQLTRHSTPQCLQTLVVTTGSVPQQALPRLDTTVVPDGSGDVTVVDKHTQNRGPTTPSIDTNLSPQEAGAPALNSPASSYLSLSEAESDDDDEGEHNEKTDEQIRAERRARELERQRVLEAAGLIVKPATEAPPKRPTRRRKAPAPPSRASVPATVPEDTTLEPPAPEDDDIPPPLPPKTSTFELDDAFERYQRYQQTQPAQTKRMSVSSFDAVPPSPAGTTSSLSMHSMGESRYGALFALFTRSKTPGNDEQATASSKPRLVISGPLAPPAAPSRENSPAFGSVSLMPS